MNKTTAIILGVIAGLVIVYFIFRDKINRYFGIGSQSPSWASCDKSFFVKLSNGNIQALSKSNDGTEDNPQWKYYKKDVTIGENGITNSGDNKEITESEFKGMCKFKYDPPYAWYTVNTSEEEGHKIKK